MKVLLKDIANEAGVSTATVSRIINGSVPVSTSLEEKVLSAAEKLGYIVETNLPAVKKFQQKSNVIGLIVSDFSNPFFQVLMRGVLNEARSSNYGVQVFETNENVQTEVEIFKSLQQFDLAGIIVSASRVQESVLLQFSQRSEKPIVLINRYVKAPNVSCIIVDYERSMIQAATHLINLGHRRIAYLAGPAQSESSQDRKRGIIEAMRRARLSLDPLLCLDSFPNIEGGFSAMVSLLGLPKEKQPTGVLAYNDLVALGALRAIRLKNMRVPEDISLIGNDNIEMLDHTYPPLTTVSPPKNHMGILAMQSLNQMISGKNGLGDGFIQVDAPLTLRYSTGPVNN